MGVVGCLFFTSRGAVVVLSVSGSAELAARVGDLVLRAWAGYLDAEPLVVTLPAALVGTVLFGLLAANGIVRMRRA